MPPPSHLHPPAAQWNTDLFSPNLPPAPGSTRDDPGGIMRRSIDRYVQERVNKGELAKRSATCIRSKLRLFADRWPDLDPTKITRRHVDGWMATPGLSPAYRRARLSALRGYCQWLVLNGHLTKDPTLGVKPPKMPVYAPRYLSHELVADVLAHAPDTRTRLAVLLMVSSGLRRIEVARAQVGDIDLHRKTMAVRGKGGQGHPTRTVPLSTQTCQTLDQYLTEANHNAGPLIRSAVHPERGVSAQTIGKWVTDAMRAGNVKHMNGDGRSPHALRHTCAQDVIDLGSDIRALQSLLGHATIKTTEWYLRGDVRTTRALVDERSY